MVISIKMRKYLIYMNDMTMLRYKSIEIERQLKLWEDIP